MRKLWSLTRVLLKDIGSAFEIKFGGKDNKWAGPVLWGVVGLGILPLLFVLYFMFQGMYAVFAPAGQLSYITGLLLSLVGVVIFLFSAFSAPAIFYFSKEVEYLLPLPLKPTKIIGAKFLVSLVYEYALALCFLAPLFAAYAAHLPAGPLVVHTILAFITLPILPLIYSTVLVMLLMRLSRFGRNRDRYNMLVGLLAVLFGFGFSLFSQQLNNVNAEQVENLISGNQTTLMAVRSLFPNAIFAGEAIASSSVAGQMINIAITAVALVVFFLLARVLYFKGVIGISESSAPAKKMTRAEILKQSHGQSMFNACLQKELRLLFRSPTAFMNCVLMVFLLPIMMLVPTFMNLNTEGGEIMALLSAVSFDDPLMAAYVMTGAAAMGFLLSAMNMVTSTSISREGPNYYIMKYIPVSYRTQLNAKAASGILVSLMGLALIFIILEVLFKAPPAILIGAFLLTLPGTVMLNYAGLLIDLMKPKLTWDNEQRAVKQNLNVMVLMLVGIVLTVVVAVVGALFLKTPGVAFTVLMLFCTVLAVAAYYFVINVGSELMTKLSD